MCAGTSLADEGDGKLGMRALHMSAQSCTGPHLCAQDLVLAGIGIHLAVQINTHLILLLALHAITHESLSFGIGSDFRDNSCGFEWVRRDVI